MMHSFKNVLVVGLGKTGASVCRFLKSQGVTVYGAEDNLQLAAVSDCELVTAHFAKWHELDAVVVSPGIPWCWPSPHPLCLKARQLGIPLITDVDLFITQLSQNAPKAKIIGITGTNGKSTTTALMTHALNALEQPALMGGNIGVPVLDLPQANDHAYVLELSSYQLELSRSFFAHVALLVNISPDHLSRHGGMAGYVAAKARIFEGLNQGGVGIIGVDDDHCRALYDYLKPFYGPRIIPVSTGHELPYGVYMKDGCLVDALDAPTTIGPLDAMPTLRGIHNWQNMVVAYAALRSLNCAGADLLPAFKTFPGLAHRQEVIAQKDNVVFINDSKATNVDSVSKALPCYENIYWILGGQPKEGGLSGLEPYLSQIRHAYVIGQSAPDFAAFFKAHGVPHTSSGTLDVAVAQAAQAAFLDPNPAVVLLSPACASWDQFASFEARGNAFRTYVEKLLQEASCSV